MTLLPAFGADAKHTKGKAMKRLAGVFLGLALISGITVTTARGQTNGAMWTVDENGPALLNGSLVGYANGSYKPDPVSGLVGWYYPLGPSVPGDVLMPEPTSGTNSISDLLRFDGQGVFFFSDLETNDPNPDKADVPRLPIPVNPVPLDEVGVEGNNGAFYFPGPNMPGFDASGQLPGLSYHFISDVPEPSSAVFLLGAATLLGLNIIRRRTSS